jgi:hypothetical protein
MRKCWKRRTAVHPHAGGEHAPTLLRQSRPPGSSPRSWGTPATGNARSFTSRFIPTLIGSTASRIPASRCRPVHPHAREEHTAIAVLSDPFFGSSPRSWGARQQPLAGFHAQRFILTTVRNTIRLLWPPRSHSVHPHARGKHMSRVDRPKISIGSSRACGEHIVRGR